MRRFAAGLAIAVLALTAAGCGSSDKGDGKASDLPTYEPSESASESATPTPSATASPVLAFDDKGHEAVPGTITVANPKQSAVADAWLAYWTVRANSYGTATADPAAIGKVATGDAASGIVKYVAYLSSKKLRTVGDSKIGVSKVRISGNAAGLVSCMENKSIDRREDGTPAEELTPYYQWTGVLTRTGGTWVVAQAVKTSNAKCTA